MKYKKALEATSAASTTNLDEFRDKHTPTFTKFVSHWSPDTVKSEVMSVYAQDAYFNDTLKELTGRDQIAEYMERSLGATTGVAVEVNDIAYGNSDFYYRWTMKIYFKSLNNRNPGVSEGMSQIRYTEDGLIALHRDFWDAASGIFEYLPVFRSAMPWVKGKF
tara:strand:- start:893 stop:1381 length:489 start_codon:yes stop_codon:yes gene_type:complete